MGRTLEIARKAPAGAPAGRGKGDVGRILAGELLKMISEECTKERWTKFFLEAHKGLSFVILTREEDGALTKAGLRSAIVPVDQDASPLARYIKAGVQGEFMSLLDDPRWT